MDIYRLAVCEDDESLRIHLHTLCHEILTDKKIEHEITDFSSAQELEEVLTAYDGPFDLLILDIQMEGLTGMELARRLRRRNDRVSIIFVTGCVDYLPEGYAVQPVHFLLKPVSTEALAEALFTDWKLNHQPRTFMLQLGAKTVLLPLDKIRYIESLNHSIIIHQDDGERFYRLSLSEIERQLPGDRFCRCHNSYLVNMEYVEEVGRNRLSLRGGEEIPVGRACYNLMQSAFIRYINQ